MPVLMLPLVLCLPYWSHYSCELIHNESTSAKEFAASSINDAIGYRSSTICRYPYNVRALKPLFSCLSSGALKGLLLPLMLPLTTADLDSTTRGPWLSLSQVRSRNLLPLVKECSFIRYLWFRVCKKLFPRTSLQSFHRCIYFFECSMSGRSPECLSCSWCIPLYW